MLFILIGLGIWIWAFFYHTETGGKIRKFCWEAYEDMMGSGEPKDKDDK